MALRDRLLGTSAGYGTFRKLVGADRATETIVSDHLRPRAGMRILDIGCGNGDLARFLPDVEYVGVDHNTAYIDRADADFGATNVRFIDADLADLPSMDLGTFDLAVAIGVIHHLDDELAAQVAATSRTMLADGGRLVTVDPVFDPEQRSVTRVMMALDRGRYVRHPAHYRLLLSGAFATVEQSIRTDLLPIPYTHCIMEASA